MITSKFRLISVNCLLLLLTSCQMHPLTVQTQYLTSDTLASFYVNTPDLKKNKALKGQRLLIQWSLPSCIKINSDLSLYLKVRYRNHQEQEINIPIDKRVGFFTYDLLNEDYDESRGVSTYLAEIHQGDRVIERWKHPLWTEMITFDFPTN